MFLSTHLFCRDKRAAGAQFLTFALMQRSVVLLCMDSRASVQPAWVTQTGFVQMDGVEVGFFL